MPARLSSENTTGGSDQTPPVRLIILGSIEGPIDGQRRLTRALGEGTKLATTSFDFNGHRKVYGIAKILWQCLKATAIGLSQRADIIYIALSRTALGMFRDLLIMLPIKLSGAPVVAHVHGAEFESFFLQDKKLGWAKRLYLRQLKYIIFVHEALVPANNVLQNKVKVVRNPIPTFAAQYSERESASPTGEPVTMGFISSFIPGKGLENVLDLADLFQDHTTIIVAGGPNNRFLEYGKIIQDRVLKTPGVKYLGYLNDPTIFFEHVDFAIFPTSYVSEAVPGVVIEALATGAVPILTAHNHLPDVFFGAPIIWVDHLDALPETAARALATPKADLARMKIEGAAWVRQNFPSLEGWIAQVEDILREARR